MSPKATEVSASQHPRCDCDLGDTSLPARARGGGGGPARLLERGGGALAAPGRMEAPRGAVRLACGAGGARTTRLGLPGDPAGLSPHFLQLGSGA